MAILPSTPLVKMNDIEISNDSPVTNDVMRKIGIDLNALIDRQGVSFQEFFANGTFVVPANVNHVWVFACGGGGGGAGNGGIGGGGGGGAGSVPTLLHTLVTPSSSIPITIGAGGSDVVGAVIGNGGPGGNTLFGTLLTFTGAAGGIHGNGQPALGGAGGMTGRGYKTYGGQGIDPIAGGLATAGESSFFGVAGIPASGGSGGAGFGNGGNAGAAFNAPGQAGQGYGSGGGGNNSVIVGNHSGPGAPGYLRVVYANS